MHTLLQSAERIKSILGLWSMAGRARESAWTLWSAALWEKKHAKLYQRVPMTKSGSSGREECAPESTNFQVADAS